MFASFSGAGGVERMLLNLAAGIAASRLRRGPADHPPRQPRTWHALPAGVRHLPLPGGHAWAALPALARYLRREPRPALLAAKDRANRVAVLARALAGRSLARSCCGLARTWAVCAGRTHGR